MVGDCVLEISNPELTRSSAVMDFDIVNAWMLQSVTQQFSGLIAFIFFCLGVMVGSLSTRNMSSLHGWQTTHSGSSPRDVIAYCCALAFFQLLGLDVWECFTWQTEQTSPSFCTGKDNRRLLRSAMKIIPSIVVEMILLLLTYIYVHTLVCGSKSNQKFLIKDQKWLVVGSTRMFKLSTCITFDEI